MLVFGDSYWLGILGYVVTVSTRLANWREPCFYHCRLRCHLSLDLMILVVFWLSFCIPFWMDGIFPEFLCVVLERNYH